MTKEQSLQCVKHFINKAAPKVLDALQELCPSSGSRLCQVCVHDLPDVVEELKELLAPLEIPPEETFYQGVHWLKLTKNRVEIMFFLDPKTEEEHRF